MWRIFEEAHAGRTSVPHVLQFARLDVTAGAHPTAGYYWLNELLAMYRRRRTVCFRAVDHWNLVGDASTHTKKETFLSLLWSWTNAASAYGDVQRLWPSSYMLPIEQDLPDEVAILLAQGKQQRLHA